MPRYPVVLLIGTLFGTGFGFLLGAATAPGPDGRNTMDAAHDHAAHDHDGGAHATLRAFDGPAPDLTLRLYPDGDQSRNLHIGVTGFTFDPEGVNGAHVPGHGHAHVYLNGVKQARAYGPWVQLHALPRGTHAIRVTLNANDHSQYAISGQPVEATVNLRID
ncbi:MAG: hypothetical protein NXH74_02195 [Rhodobacteraceae bacterium]|nr:hypothetical protein [Paracoccaceae bacterium]